MIISIIFFMFLYVLVVNLSHAKLELKTARSFENLNVYQITDHLLEGRETEFFSDVESYDILNRFNNSLNTSPEFTYYSATWQPIGIADFNGDPTYDPNYDYDGTTTPTHTLNNKVYSSVKSVQVNEEVFNRNNLDLKAGRFFSKEEYTYNEKFDSIPVILGSQFSELYQIGDKVDIFLYGKELKGEIIGFLSPSQKVMTLTETELLLDKYVILPAFKFNDSISKNFLQGNELFVRATLLSRINSLLLTESSPIDIRRVLEKISEETQFFDFAIIGADDLKIDALVNMTKVNIENMYILTSILLVIILATYFMTLSSKAKRNFDTYIVFLISGANLSEIKKNLTLEFILMVVIGMFVAAIPFFLLTGFSLSILLNYVFISLMVILVIFFLAKTFVNSNFKRIDIVQQLKGR
jgi:hypothetical protein